MFLTRDGESVPAWCTGEVVTPAESSLCSLGVGAALMAGVWAGAGGTLALHYVVLDAKPEAVVIKRPVKDL